jgi:ribonuclease R
VANRKQQKQRRPRKDPNLAREAKKYDNPIPSREFIMQTLNEEGCPLSFNKLVFHLQITEEQSEALDFRLRAMVRDGQVILNRKGGYCVINKTDLIVGRVIGHKDGFGFLTPEEGGDDLFLLPREMRQVLHGDRVVVRVSGVDNRGRHEGAIVEVLERAHSRIVGRIHLESEVGFVRADNKRITHEIIIPGSELGGASEGDIVSVELMVQPSRRTQAVGKVVEVLGEHMAPGMETDVAILSHEIPVEWPEAVEQQITEFSAEVSETDKQGREDLRHLPLVTIDGEDARDFDDAVHCQRTKNGWRLYVAIADVSNYVKPGKPLDKEGYKRGNSVYFPDRVIPMLPEILSNGLCSLKPKVDRLCMVCEMLLNHDGKIVRSRFYEAVMHSHARLTYNKVAAMLVDGDNKLRKQYADLVPHIEELYALYKVLVVARKNRGTIEFETTETRAIFKDGKIENIVPVVRNDAHKIIEECMLAANVATASLLQRKKVPALYRIHESPPIDKLTDLRQFLGESGLTLGGGDKPTGGDYSKLLAGIQDRPDKELIQTVLLRSMSQAVYSTENVGHFGLSYDAYAHFTSPIRRYPDLLVHRALKHVGKGGKPRDFHYSVPELQGIAEHCSTTERRADEATRDAMDTLKCEYLVDKVGEEFDGIITSVTGFGLFVMLDDIYVDGLVHITALDRDYFHFDPIGHRLNGERSGITYRLGDPLRIRIAAVNIDDRKIDFVLPDDGKDGDKKNHTKKRSRKRSNKQGNKQGNKQSSQQPAKQSNQQSDKQSNKQPRKRRRRR